MTAPESRHHELYNGLTEILGAELTDTLMTYLPATPIQDQISKLEDAINLLTHRIDQLQNILMPGFMSMIVALIVVGVFA